LEEYREASRACQSYFYATHCFKFISLARAIDMSPQLICPRIWWNQQFQMKLGWTSDCVAMHPGMRQKSSCWHSWPGVMALPALMTAAVAAFLFLDRKKFTLAFSFPELRVLLLASFIFLL
jgi:hypothetical protein